MTTGVAPHDTDAEQALLGAMLLTSTAIHDAIDTGLTSADYYNPNHAHIHEAIIRLHHRGIPADIITVHAELNGHGDQIGGKPFLAQLQAQTPTSYSSRHYARIVHEHAQRRRLAALLHTARDTVLEGHDPTHLLDQLTHHLPGHDTTSLQIPDLAAITNGTIQEEPPTLLTRLDNQALLYPGRLCCIYGEPSVGKAQPLHALVLTPTGWTTMGALQVGDLVVGTDGVAHPVTAIYPQGPLEVWHVTTSDGVTVECSADHLWTTTSHNDHNRGGQTTRRTEDLAAVLARTRRALYLPDVAPIEFDTTGPLPVPPYLLGLLLGDGGLTKGITFTSADPELHDAVAELSAPFGITPKPAPNDPITVALTTPRGKPNPLLDAVRALGLFGVTSHRKFIPSNYLRSTIDDRFDLLCGLMDTDGYLAGTTPIYTTVSQQLADDIAELARSLGGLATIRRKVTPGYTSYNVTITLDRHPFRLARKQLTRPPSGRHRRRIVAVERTGCSVDQQCITVASPDSLYITDGYVPTHNTWIAYAAGAETLRNGGSLLVLDWEDSATNFVIRMRALGVADPIIADPTRVVYINPELGLRQTADRQHLVDIIEQLPEPVMVIVDAYGPALARDGIEENSNTDVLAWTDQALSPLTRAGALVLILDHVSKDPATRTRGGRGAGAKLALITGAAYEVRTIQAFSRTRPGRLKLVIAKDRLGHVGPVGANAGEVVITPDDDRIHIDIEPPADHDDSVPFRPTHLMERVSRYVEAAPEPVSARTITGAVQGKNEPKREAIRLLTAEGYLTESEREGRGGGSVFTSVKPFRESDSTAPQSRPNRAPGADQSNRVPAPPRNEVRGAGTRFELYPDPTTNSAAPLDHDWFYDPDEIPPFDPTDEPPE